jgi:membrane protease YdiL (CAAX protease family)
MKKLKKWKGLDHTTSLFLLLLSALFLEVVVTKALLLIWPERETGWSASDINKYYMPFMALLIIPFWLKTPLEVRWSALKFRDRKMIGREMLVAVLVSAGIVLAIVGVRLWMNAHDPEAAARPWFGLYLNVHGRWFYPLSVIVQEIMIKAFIQENIRRANTTDNKHITVILTGLFFAILHMNYPLYYLVAAGLLCMLTGYLYERNGNIWDAVLIHFTLGFMPRALGMY